MKYVYFFSGMFAGLSILSISKASVPQTITTSDALTEIRVRKEVRINFDSDIMALAKLEKSTQFQDKLPGQNRVSKSAKTLRR